MLGSPPPNYFGVSIDRLRNYIPPSYNLQSPKILPPPTLSMSPARTVGLLPPSLSPRGSSSRLAASNHTHSSPRNDAIAMGLSRRRRSVDLSLRPFSSKRNSMDSPSSSLSSSVAGSSSSSSSWSSMTSMKANLSEPSSTTIISSPSSSSASSLTSKQLPSSSLPFPSPYPTGPVFPGLGLNPMTSALALNLKMGMFTPPQHILNNNNNNNNNKNNDNISKPYGDELTKHASKMMANFPKPHPYLIPFGSRVPPTSSHPTSPPASISSPPSSASSSAPISIAPPTSSLSSSSSPPSASSSLSSSSPSSSSSSSSLTPSTMHLPMDISSPGLFPYPKLFTPFLTPEEQQQQYLTMFALQQQQQQQQQQQHQHQQATSAHSPKDSSSPPSHGFKNAQASAFATRNYLELAMLVCNTFRGKLFPCPHCRYVTDRRNNLKRHVATMHQACDKQLECCGVTFATKASLREHIAIFHHNGYSCTFCGRRFCRKALLKRHLSVHNGQKDYTCPNCDYATSHKSNLERHKRIHARLPENGESPIFPDMSLDDDVTTSDVDFKNRNLMEMPTSSTNDYTSASMGIPYHYYSRLYNKSFPNPHSTSPFTSSNSKENDAISMSSASMQNAMLQHPYFFKDIPRNSPFSKSDLMVTSTSLDVSDEEEAEEDRDRDEDNDSDSDIDIDSLDDNDNIVLEKSSVVEVEEVDDDKFKDNNNIIPNTISQSTAKTTTHIVSESGDNDDNGDNDDDDDSNRPLNLVKVRQENE